MLCQKCNAQNPDGSTFCNNCGASLNSSSNYYSNSTPTNKHQYNGPVDNPSHFAGMISCCFPIVGLILYFIWKDEKPNSADLVCKWMIGGVIAWVLFYVLFFIIGAGASSMSYY